MLPAGEKADKTSGSRRDPGEIRAESWRFNPGKGEEKNYTFRLMFCGQNHHTGNLPFTLTLSLQAGRGDVPHERVLLGENGAAYPFAPLAGRRWPAGRMRGKLTG